MKRLLCTTAVFIALSFVIGCFSYCFAGRFANVYGYDIHEISSMIDHYEASGNITHNEAKQYRRNLKRTIEWGEKGMKKKRSMSSDEIDRLGFHLRELHKRIERQTHAPEPRPRGQSTRSRSPRMDKIERDPTKIRNEFE
jgi:polyhydroxyalkanoate synthesis regulator phasin